MFDFERDISHIPGWLTKNEASFLYNTAKKISKKENIVEIGSWKGRSTVALGLGAKDGLNAKIYAVDPHKDTTEHKQWSGENNKYDTYSIFLRNIQRGGVGKYVEPLRMTSKKASDSFKKPVSFLFIDGSHHFKDVKLDYELWFPKLVNGGFVAFHDAWHSMGVLAITTFMMLTSNRIKNPRLVDTLIIFQKTVNNNLLDRIFNFLFIFYRLLFGWIGSVKMHVLGGTNETSTMSKRFLIFLKLAYSKIR